MKRVAILARLKAGAHEQAQDLIERGPPFDLAAEGFERHAVYLSRGEIVFVFEGREVEWRLDDLVSNFLQPALRESFEAWRPLLDGRPRLAREAYFWDPEAPGNEVGGAGRAS